MSSKTCSDSGQADEKRPKRQRTISDWINGGSCPTNMISDQIAALIDSDGQHLCYCFSCEANDLIQMTRCECLYPLTQVQAECDNEPLTILNEEGVEFLV